MKKFLSGIIGLTVLVSAFSAYAAEPEVFVNDGIIVINDKINDAVLNDEITVNVVKSDFDWDTESVWNSGDYNANSAEIKYYDIITTDPNGKYSVKFKLDEQGKYTVYLGSEYFKSPVVKEFYYTNTQAAKNAVDSVNNAASAEAVANALENNRYSLMLYSDKYDDVDLDEVGKLVYDYVSAQSVSLSDDELTETIYKGFMVYLLNTENITDMAEYSDCMGMGNSSVSEYWLDSYGKKVAERLKAKAIRTIDDYDEAVFYAAAGCIIENNDGTDGIKAILNEHKKRTGMSQTITDVMCRDIAGESLYTKSELNNWILAYDTTDSSGSGSGGSGSGGGYKTNHYDAAAGSPFNAGYESLKNEKVDELESIFTDLQEVEWAREAIENLYSRGIISGREERLFAPNNTVLREEFVKMLTSTFKLNLVAENMNFTDVEESAWYYKYISCAYAAEIAKGFSDEFFGIGENITRQDLCVMIANTLKVCEITVNENYEAKSFTDEDEIADYAKDAVMLMQKLGAVNGYTDGRFEPMGTATRAEAAKIMYMISAYVA